MPICCFDLEGVLLPEFWIRIADRLGLAELRLTTRDIADYDRLMRYRLRILRREGIKLADLQEILAKVRPLPGARRFLDRIRASFPVIILSDTYYEFAGPGIQKLGQPVLFCNWLKTDRKGFIRTYVLRQRNGKLKSVRALKGLGFQVTAVGDSYNDLGMLKTAQRGILFNPPESIRTKYRQFPVTHTYAQLEKAIRGSALP
ncbi:MAG: bifunctional phosphoserine phosphatase/homoserine phosphotransferase ThrH [Candidatus Omnitrophota bacterium]|jgi:phosphoserine/homoserine phosphotransferase